MIFSHIPLVVAVVLLSGAVGLSQSVVVGKLEAGPVQNNAPPSQPAPGNNAGLQLSDDQQEFTFKSNSLRLSLPNGQSFTLPPGFVLPPDIAAQLANQQQNSQPPPDQQDQGPPPPPPPPSMQDEGPDGVPGPGMPNSQDPGPPPPPPSRFSAPESAPRRQDVARPHVQVARYQASSAGTYQGWGS